MQHPKDYCNALLVNLIQTNSDVKTPYDVQMNDMSYFTLQCFNFALYEFLYATMKPLLIGLKTFPIYFIIFFSMYYFCNLTLKKVWKYCFITLYIKKKIHNRNLLTSEMLSIVKRFPTVNKHQLFFFVLYY